MTPVARPHGHKLNKLGKGPLGDAKFKALGLVVSDKKIFSYSPYVSLCKTCDHGVGPFLAPEA